MKPLLQSEAAECGLASLGMVANHHGYEADLASLRQRFGLSMKGATLAQLMQIASQMQLAARPLKLGMADLGKLKLPCVLHWEFNHFVVLAAVGRNSVTLYDPAIGKRVMALEEVAKRFTGVALELTPTPGFEKKQQRLTMPLSSLWRGLSGQRRAYGQILGLALTLQLFALLMPLFMQLVVDQVLPAAEQSLLTTLGLGFVLLVLLQTSTEALRAWVVVQLGVALNFQMVANLLHHLLRLPMSFFEKRYLGDVVSRFGSLDAIQRSMTTSFIEALVDGVMVLFAGALMLLYSPSLAAITLLAVLIFGLGRWLLFGPFREASYDELLRHAKQDSHFLESLRGVQALKLFNRLAEREGAWQNLFIARLNAQAKVARMSLGFAAFNHGLFGLLNIAIIWLGAQAVLSGGFSVGMLYAFLAYKTQFADKAAGFIEKLIEFRMLGLHAERVADIALTAPEPDIGIAQRRELKGHIEVQGLSYRYSPLDAPVFSNVSLDAAPGECLVLAGPSGCGKTTLMKVMLGLLPPSAGEVRVDGENIATLGADYRESIGVVMQEDTLFAGSIANNIAFGDAVADPQKIMAAAQLAAVHDDIARLPMSYNTLVGDMGSALSGGQKQRVLLARALYRQPRILFLDEASSHLDIAAEQTINTNLRALGITRIVIAHRPETIQSGDKVVWLIPVSNVHKSPTT